MRDDSDVNPFRVLDETGSFEAFVEAVGELMQERVLNYVGSEADWLRMREALMSAIDREDAGWDQAASEREADE